MPLARLEGPLELFPRQIFEAPLAAFWQAAARYAPKDLSFPAGSVDQPQSGGAEPGVQRPVSCPLRTSRPEPEPVRIPGPAQSDCPRREDLVLCSPRMKRHSPDRLGRICS